VKFTRDTLFGFFAAAPKALIGMEACPGAQWMARKLSGARPHCADHASTVRQAVCEVE
jgi:hypothetical protein